jgi:adenosylcobyric acid synthase
MEQGVGVVDTAEDGELLGCQHGPVLGTALHSMFEEPAVLRRLFGCDVTGLDAAIDRLAGRVAGAFGPRVLDELLGRLAKCLTTSGRAR